MINWHATKLTSVLPLKKSSKHVGQRFPHATTLLIIDTSVTAFAPFVGSTDNSVDLVDGCNASLSTPRSQMRQTSLMIQIPFGRLHKRCLLQQLIITRCNVIKIHCQTVSHVMATKWFSESFYLTQQVLIDVFPIQGYMQIRKYQVNIEIAKHGCKKCQVSRSCFTD